jgi:ketosteroid isomerase-like protein
MCFQLILKYWASSLLHFLYSPDFVWWYSRSRMLAAAYEGKTIRHWLMDLARVRLTEMEKRGILPKGK